MSPTALTPKQKQVLDYILKYSEEKGYAPSQKEIARHFEFRSLGTVQNYLVRLERHGLLEKDWNAKRGIAVRPQPTPQESATGSGAVPLPLVGRVAAGVPIEAIENQDRIDIPLTMLDGGGSKDHFVLKVQGDSMIEDGILDGDFAVIKRRSNARNGETVVARVGEEATLKRFQRRKEGGKTVVALEPANSAYEPIMLDAANTGGRDLSIEGVLVGVIRKL